MTSPPAKAHPFYIAILEAIHDTASSTLITEKTSGTAPTTIKFIIPNSYVNCPPLNDILPPLEDPVPSNAAYSYPRAKKRDFEDNILSFQETLYGYHYVRNDQTNKEIDAFAKALQDRIDAFIASPPGDLQFLLADYSITPSQMQEALSQYLQKFINQTPVHRNMSEINYIANLSYDDTTHVSVLASNSYITGTLCQLFYKDGLYTFAINFLALLMAFYRKNSTTLGTLIEAYDAYASRTARTTDYFFLSPSEGASYMTYYKSGASVVENRSPVSGNIPEAVPGGPNASGVSSKDPILLPGGENAFRGSSIIPSSKSDNPVNFGIVWPTLLAIGLVILVLVVVCIAVYFTRRNNKLLFPYK